MDKVTLKIKLIEARGNASTLKEEHANYQSGGNLNPEDVRDADDDSHREQTEEYLQALEREIHQRENEIKTFRDLAFCDAHLGRGAGNDGGIL
jgi:hypothetical protein